MRCAAVLTSCVLADGAYAVRVDKLGFRPETAFVELTGGRDTTITLPLVEQAARVSPIIVTSTRTERRLQQEPLRVEVLAGDDITEKNEMRPADALTPTEATTVEGTPIRDLLPSGAS